MLHVPFLQLLSTEENLLCIFDTVAHTEAGKKMHMSSQPASSSQISAADSVLLISGFGHRHRTVQAKRVILLTSSNSVSHLRLTLQYKRPPVEQST